MPVRGFRRSAIFSFFVSPSKEKLHQERDQKCHQKRFLSSINFEGSGPSCRRALHSGTHCPPDTFLASLDQHSLMTCTVLGSLAVGLRPLNQFIVLHRSFFFYLFLFSFVFKCACVSACGCVLFLTNKGEAFALAMSYLVILSKHNIIPINK